MLDMLSRKQEPKFSSGNSKVSSGKKISWLIEQAPSEPVRMIITPEIATAMLQYNTDNRPVSESNVDRLASEIAKGAWMETPVPVIFSDKGRLIDGQHRLQAVLKSGLAIESWVAFGAKDEAFAVIDTGRKRTGGDVFAIHGVPNSNAMAATTKWLHVYLNNRSAAGGVSGGSGAQVTNVDLYAFYLGLKGIHDSSPTYSRLKTNGIPAPTAGMAVHYLCAQKNRAMADEFFRKLATGVGFESKRDPAYKLRERLTRTGDQKPSPRSVFAYTVQAWNAARRRKQVQRFEFEGGPLPRVV